MVLAQLEGDDMTKYYQIGETAKLFNISVQTLRFYEKKGLIAPEYTDPVTKYRYYSPKQFHYIDRIHYLKSLGLSLGEIKEILQSGQVDSLQFFLQKNIDKRKKELENLKEIICDLEWYIRYFNYMDHRFQGEYMHVSKFEERYMLSAPCSYCEPFEEIEVRLTKLKSRDEFKDLHYRRHYSFMIDFEEMMKQHFAPTAALIFLKRKPKFVSPFIMTLPAGEYLCFSAQLRLDEWDSQEVSRFFETSGRKPVFAVAHEYEDNLVEYTATPYEVQVYLN